MQQLIFLIIALRYGVVINSQFPITILSTKWYQLKNDNQSLSLFQNTDAVVLSQYQCNISQKWRFSPSINKPYYIYSDT